MKQLTISFILFFIGFIFFGIYSLMGIDLHHDGIMFKAAVDVANGCRVFKETFSQYGILPPLLQGLAVKIFGAELIVLRLLTAFFYGLSLVVFDLVMKRFFTSKEYFYRIFSLFLFLCLSPDLCVTSHPWSSVYALFFLLLTIYFTLCYFEEEKTHIKFALASGMTTAIVFGFRQPCGVTTLMAVSAIAIMSILLSEKNTKKFILGFSGGLLAVLAIYAILITYWGAWQDYWIQSWKNIFAFAIKRGAGDGSINGVMINFFPFVSDDRGFVDSIFAFFPLLTLIVFAKLMLTHSWKNNFSLVILLVYSLSAWHQYYPVPCMRHIYWASIPMLGVFAIVIKQLFQKGNLKGKVAIILLLLILFPAIAMRSYFGFVRLKNIIPYSTVDLPGLRGLHLYNHEKEFCQIIYNIIQTTPADIIKRGVFNHTPDGVWSVVFPACKTTHPMFCRLGGDVYSDYDKYALQYCMKNKPIVISTVWENLPDYSKIQELFYNGYTYYILRPLK